MTRVLLLRHAEHDWLGRGLAGRLPQVSLNAQGRSRAASLAASWAGPPLSAIVSSPQPRALQTVEPLARKLGLEVGIARDFDEIEFGEWTGLTFDMLAERHAAEWKHWVDRRATAQPPGGEPFAEVAARAMAGLRRLQQEHAGGCVLVASHGDVIKAAVAGVLGLSLDHLERFEVAPASVTEIEGERVLLLNAQPAH